MEITSLNQLDLNANYTYADYFSWKIKERIELLKGKIVAMSPAPAPKHQRILNFINYQFLKALDGKTCEVFIAPFDVRLERVRDDKKVLSVVQPDICVICDESKLDDRGCLGAPELVVEILSPGNSDKEMKQKFELYEAAGVLEYWIVNPAERIVLQYFLQNEILISHRPLIHDDVIHSKVIEGFSMELAKVFEKS